jgi:hypothetical protein
MIQYFVLRIGKIAYFSKQFSLYEGYLAAAKNLAEAKFKGVEDGKD